MKSIVVNNFGGGIADDKYNANPGEYSIAKHFDTLTHPRRLQPLRGMTTHTASTVIGNIIGASNGLMYGVGVDGSNPSNGKLWKLGGYGSSDDYAALSTNQLSGATVNYDFLVDWPDAGNVRTIHWASNNLLVASDPAGGSSASTQALTFSSIGQGFVHPKDKVLYFPYRTSTTPYIGKLTSNASPFGALSSTAFTLPLQYRAYCLTNWNNYLAIPLTSVASLSDVNSSIVALWNRDTSLTTFDETIPWGNGALKVLNNINGALIGISELGSDSLQAETPQDYNAILIKVWNGGAEPTLIKELKAFHFAGSNRPSVSINPRVNFVNKNRLYFSVNVNPNDGTSPAHYGLWSVGKNMQGQWVVQLERMATDTGTETSVIAAAIAGDFVSMAHTAAGTLTRTRSGVTSSSTYSATSVYESAVNPNMEAFDATRRKKLISVGVTTLPLLSSQSVVMKARIDSDHDANDWVTVFTKTSASPDTNTTFYEAPITPAMALPDGVHLEFRLESTGGAVITSFGYKYETLPNQL
jgi:hypothetical protein